MKISDYSAGSTDGLRLLDKQLINEINKLAPNTLVSFADFVNEGSACHAYAQKPAVEALKKAVSERGKTMVVNSAYRTLAQQMVLYRYSRTGQHGIRVAAKPGMSNHNGGLAIDIEDAQGWKQFLQKYGWRWLGAHDPMHFDYRGAHCVDLRPLSIKAFQRLWNANNPTNKLREDGSWGPRTEVALLSSPIEGWLTSSEDSGPDTLNEMAIKDRETLKFGDKGEDVRKLQKALIEQGFAVGNDGIFGQQTLVALKSFQQMKGLAADGIAGDMTQEVLGL